MLKIDVTHVKSVKNYFYPSLMKNQDEDGRTDGPTDKVTYRVACTRLKNEQDFLQSGINAIYIINQYFFPTFNIISY